MQGFLDAILQECQYYTLGLALYKITVIGLKGQNVRILIERWPIVTYFSFKKNSDKQKCVFPPSTRMIIGAARPVSGADVVLWRLGTPFKLDSWFYILLSPSSL